MLSFTFCVLAFYGCSNSTEESNDNIENSPSSETTIQTSEVDSLSIFLTGFRRAELPFQVDKNLFDSTQVIPNKFVAKYSLADDYTKFYGHYYGIRFDVNDSLYGLVFHYRYFHGMNMEFGNVSNDYEGSDILFISADGKIIKKIPSVYDHNLENYPIMEGNYSKSSSALVKLDGSVVISSSQKFGTMKDRNWSKYEETESEYHFSWTNSTLIKDKDIIVGYNTEKLNPKSREEIAESLKKFKDITFVPIVKKADTYYRIRPGCVEGRGEFKFMTQNTSGTFEFISGRYCPLFVDESNEYSVHLITEVNFDQTSDRYSLSLIEFVEGETKPDFDKAAWNLGIIRSNDGFWRMSKTPNDWLEDQGVILADEEFASKLEFTDSPCTEQ